MEYFHVDVFSKTPMSGNGLIVVFPERMLDGSEMLAMTREFRQFETIFVFETHKNNAYPVKIFTMEEELEFAGHPVIGASAVIHRKFYTASKTMHINLDLSGRIVSTESYQCGDYYDVSMNQGTPAFIKQIDTECLDAILGALNLELKDIDEAYPAEVVSTGLPYLLIPLKANLARAKICAGGFEKLLSFVSAKFVYLFDTQTLECRTWDNGGITEDVATGSAAGPLCAYLVKNGFKKSNEVIHIHQGSFLGRPSIINGFSGQSGVIIRGNVSFFASGSIEF